MMAHYAVLDENNIVVNVIVGKDENEPLPEGYSSWEEYYGGIRTSYNTYGNVHSAGGTPFRKNYAGVGYFYDKELDGFRAPQPFPSWKLNYDTFVWEAPKERPSHVEGCRWIWSEINLEWVSIKG
jgi:hypothetical protein